MKVYIMERGIFDDRRITGVYATLDAAKADAPADSTWLSDGEGLVYNQLDWGNATDITEWEVQLSAEQEELNHVSN